jgi:hypothetical protein
MGEMSLWKAFAITCGVLAAQLGAIYLASDYMDRQGEENMRRWREDQAKKGRGR